MAVTVGTFNLNNLFSRFNFQAEVPNDQGGDGPALKASYTFDDPTQVRLRRYRGALVRGKKAQGRKHVAQRLLGTHPDIKITIPVVDVWAVQEVEDIDTLRFFAAGELGGAYPYLVLIEGNDPRLIDLAVLSKLPLGAVTSWQHAVHPDEPDKRIFGRDLLEVDVLSPDRGEKLFTIFNNHLKSHFVPFDEDQVAGAAAANARRRQQAETIARIVSERHGPNGRVIIAGDLNDPPTSPDLAPLTNSSALPLVDGLTSPTETRPAKTDTPPPASPAWTHRYKESGQPAEYELFDHLWLSHSLAERQNGAWIMRRSTHGGQGSDHDPALLRLDL
jgi:endonuclease/exonuclease/phosphatase family metal-dependent hydrolase